MHKLGGIPICMVSCFFRVYMNIKFLFKLKYYSMFKGSYLKYTPIKRVAMPQ
jgi:hypothetical protein